MAKWEFCFANRRSSLQLLGVARPCWLRPMSLHIGIAIFLIYIHCLSLEVPGLDYRFLQASKNRYLFLSLRSLKVEEPLWNSWPWSIPSWRWLCRLSSTVIESSVEPIQQQINPIILEDFIRSSEIILRFVMGLCWRGGFVVVFGSVKVSCRVCMCKYITRCGTCVEKWCSLKKTGIRLSQKEMSMGNLKLVIKNLLISISIFFCFFNSIWSCWNVTGNMITALSKFALGYLQGWREFNSISIQFIYWVALVARMFQTEFK